MKIRYTYLLFILFAMIFLQYAMPHQLFGQLGIGFSYEKRELNKNDVLRNGIPEYGFGVRLENNFKIKVPFMKFGWRLHASAFSSSLTFNEQFNDLIDQNVSSEIVDAGFGLLGEIKMPLFANPYFGGGIGYEQQSYTFSQPVECISAPCPEIEEFTNGDGLYYNAFLGTKFSPIPLFKPFVEYRYTDYATKSGISKSFGRLQVGILLEF